MPWKNKRFRIYCYHVKFKTTNATRCNNHDDLLHLSFVLKTSLFSTTSLEPSRASIMEVFCENNKSFTIFTKKLHLTWVLNMPPFLSGDSSNLSFLESIILLLIYQTCCLIIKPFNLLNIIRLTGIKTFFSNMLMKF